MTQVMIFSDEKLPETFPDLLEEFVKKDTKYRRTKRSTLSKLIRNSLAEKYPRLDGDALNARRTIPIKIDQLRVGESRKTLKEVVKTTLEGCCKNNSELKGELLDAIPDYMMLTLPLFAYATNNEVWLENGEVTHEFKYNVPFNFEHEIFYDRYDEEKSILHSAINIGKVLERTDDNYSRFRQTKFSRFNHDGQRLHLVTDRYASHSGNIEGKLVFRHPVGVEVKCPVAPEQVVSVFPTAIADYYQAYAKAVQELKSKDPKSPSHPKMGVLWLPTVDSLKVTAKAPPRPRPIYRDPALIMDVGDKYVVGLWDIKDEKLIEGPLREWTSGSF